METKSPGTARLLIVAGFLPLPWFLIWVTIGGLLVPGYSLLAQHASELTLVSGLPNAFLKVGALGAGVFLILFSAGLWMYSDRRISWGAICWIVFGFSMLTNGIWNMGDPRHGFYAIGVLNIIAPALSLAESRRLTADPFSYWGTVIVSLSGVIYLWLIITGLDPEGFRGLSQRLFSSINSAWPAIVAWRVLADDRARRPASHFNS